MVGSQMSSQRVLTTTVHVYSPNLLSGPRTSTSWDRLAVTGSTVYQRTYETLTQVREERVQTFNAESSVLFEVLCSERLERASKGNAAFGIQEGVR